MSRRRRKRRSRKSNGWNVDRSWVGICLSLLVLVLLVVPTASYNTTEFSRQGDLDVSADDTAMIGLEKASSIEEGQESLMVTVANNVGGMDIDITVELTPPSRSEGYLVVNGNNQGDLTQIPLQSGGQQDINACFSDDGNGVPSDATFNVTFSGSGTTVSGSIDERAVSIIDNKSETQNC